MLPHYCQGDDLDHFVFAFYGGEQRLQGEEPTALYEFSLEEVLSKDVIIPQGLILSDGENNTAFLMENITIKEGDLTVIGKVKLNAKTKRSDIKTNIILSPYPYVLKPTALGAFEGGSDKETDEEFFERAILSLNRYSTAGGADAYKYFSKSADERVFDVKVVSPSPLMVHIYVLALEAQDEVLQNVKIAQGKDRIQSFCDEVEVFSAVQKSVTLTPTIYVLDLLKTAYIDETIKDNFSMRFKIGEGLPFSKIIKFLEVAGVHKVVMPQEDLEVLESEYLDITLNPTYEKAVL
jgi:phage-related baseplate assembly protein